MAAKQRAEAGDAGIFEKRIPPTQGVGIWSLSGVKRDILVCVSVCMYAGFRVQVLSRREVAQVDNVDP